jgi:hypothetical protein
VGRVAKQALFDELARGAKALASGRRAEIIDVLATAGACGSCPRSARSWPAAAARTAPSLPEQRATCAGSATELAPLDGSSRLRWGASLSILLAEIDRSLRKAG